MKIVNVIWNSKDEPNQVWDYAVTESEAKTQCASYNRKMRTGNWLTYEDANTTDKFIDGEHNPAYVPQLGIQLANYKQRTTMNYFGSFKYGDLVGEEQLKQLRKRTREFNAYQKRIMIAHEVTLGGTYKRIDVKYRKSRLDIYVYNYALQMFEREEGKYEFTH